MMMSKTFWAFAYP